MSVPNRPGFVVRVPVREGQGVQPMDSSIGSGITDEVSDRINSSSRNKSDIVIYTNSGICRYSDDLVKLANKRGINTKRIDISQTNPPSWLPGTPSLVHNGNVYCGDASFSFIESIELSPSDPAPEDKNSITQPKVKESTVGCGIGAAFAPPVEIKVDESQFDMKMEDVMQRMMASRRAS